MLYVTSVVTNGFFLHFFRSCFLFHGAFKHVSEGRAASAIKIVYEGRNVFVCLPTGYGKSLCYQTLPYVMKHELGGDTVYAKTMVGG